MLKIGLLAVLVTGLVWGAEPEAFRYRVEVLAEGIPQPMTLAMGPEGDLYFNEIGGKVRVIDAETREIREVGEVEVTTEMENGLLGMALDPKFAENGWMYLLHSPVDFQGQVISRFTIVGGKLDHGTRRDLLQIPEQRDQCCHHAGALRFGPDGNLYASTGDNTSPFASDGFTPIDEREGRGPWDAQKSSANTNDLRGKILRIRPTDDGGYEIPEGNLFAPGTEGTRAEIFAMGFRNPWRFQIDAETGIVYVGDVGPDSGKDGDRGPRGFDTVNQLREPGYFGWPYSRGGEVYADFDFKEEKVGAFFDKAGPVNLSPNNTGLKKLPAVREPLIFYPHAASEKFPLVGTGGRTACAGPVFHWREEFAETDGFPEDFDNCLLIYDWQRPFVLWARLDGESNLVGLEPFTEAVRVAQGEPDGSGRYQVRRPVDAVFGKDGALYLADYGETWGANRDSSIVKITYRRGNLPPEVVLKAEGTDGAVPLKVKLSGAGSGDPEGGELGYEWVLLPGGEVFGTAAEAELTLKEPGNYVMELRVKDGEGAEAIGKMEVTAGNSMPVVSFEKPLDGGFFTPGERLDYAVGFEDAEEGKSDPAAVVPGMVVRATWAGWDGKAVKDPPGLALMRQNDCFNCHQVDQKLVGPGFLEVAEKYRGVEGALQASVERVMKGSAGVWGEIPMLPHVQLTQDEATIMVEWVFGLEAGQTGSFEARGLSGGVPVPTGGEVQFANLEASYTDSGSGVAKPLTGSATIRLRSRRVEMESATKINGGSSRVLDYKEASGGRGVGGIENGHSLVFERMRLDGMKSVTVRVSCETKGGVIEFRAGTRDGKLLGKLEVEDTGGREEWKEMTVALEASEGLTDLWLVFVEGKDRRLFHLDWMEFR